jgi:hypothetical protein
MSYISDAVCKDIPFKKQRHLPTTTEVTTVMKIAVLVDDQATGRRVFWHVVCVQSPFALCESSNEVVWIFWFR